MPGRVMRPGILPDGGYALSGLRRFSNTKPVGRISASAIRQAFSATSIRIVGRISKAPSGMWFQPHLSAL